MNSRLILLLIILNFFYSCTKDPKVIPVQVLTEQQDTILVVGNPDASIRIINTLIKPPNRCQNFVYEIDIDTNKINDISITIYYCTSPGYSNSSIYINCLTDNIKILTSDSIIAPEILNYGDTLSLHKKWVTKNMRLIYSSCTNKIIGGDGITYNIGNWYNLSDKYIGLLIENGGNPTYAWLKLSVPNYNPVNSLTLHEIGFKKQVY